MGYDVLVVEDHRLLAQSLAVALRGAGRQVVVVDLGRTDDDDVVELARGALVVLLDLDLGTDTAGRHRDGDLLLTRLVRAGVRVVVTTGVTGQARWGRCLSEGATTVLSKTEPLDRLLAVVDTVAAGRGTPPPWAGQALRAWAESRQEQRRLRAPLRRLTPREAAVLAMLAEGLSAAVIAERDVVSEATVRSQIKAILRKLDVSSQLQAVALLNRARRLEP